MKRFDRKMIYFLIGCISFAFLIIGATYAYFTAKATDEETVKGDAATVTFGLSVDKITTVDMAFGLIPMKNSQAPNAATQMCRDDLGNAGCQMYKITINADSDTVMFLDGYITVTPRDEQLETRFTELEYNETDDVYSTKFTNEDYKSDDFIENEVIKTGVRVSDVDSTLNITDDYDCLLVRNQKIGGKDIGRQRVFYVMIWVYDNGTAQDYLQGLQLAYRGEVTFVTAEGNEISATFD